MPPPVTDSRVRPSSWASIRNSPAAYDASACPSSTVTVGRLAHARAVTVVSPARPVSTAISWRPAVRASMGWALEYRIVRRRPSLIPAASSRASCAATGDGKFGAGDRQGGVDRHRAVVAQDVHCAPLSGLVRWYTFRPSAVTSAARSSLAKSGT